MEVTDIGLTTRRARLADFIELTKPRITTLVLITTLVGFYMGSRDGLPLVILIHTLIGTALVAGGASALNQYIERHLDARMLRTRTRPLPDGRLLPTEALIFSSAISVLGTIYLSYFVNLLTGLLGLLTLTAYIFVYTPLKTRTTLCTLIGAVPGAIPPLMGWTAATGAINETALALFGILFLWQMPHFFSIAWIFTDDYLRGGFVMHRSGESTGRQIVLFCCALIPISLLPTLFGVTGLLYLIGATLLGFIYLGYGFALSLFRSNAHAQRLLRISVMYLPALLGLMMLDKTDGISKASLTVDSSLVHIDYGNVPDFALTESSGQTVKLADLRGEVWIADFIFTSCAGTCPAMTSEMRKLQDALPPGIRFVSFSVDPKRDTPEVLARYAKKYGADAKRWMFLTGDRKTLYDLSIKGFKLAFDDTQGTEAEPITHSSRFALVDREGRIRGYYNGTEADDLKKLSADSKNLL